MLKVLVIGKNPHSKAEQGEEALSEKCPSGRRIRRLLTEAGVDLREVTFKNADDWDIGRVVTSEDIMNASFVFVLGQEIPVNEDVAVMLNNNQHMVMGLPHPSAKNRYWNSPNAEKLVVKAIKESIRGAFH